MGQPYDISPRLKDLQDSQDSVVIPMTFYLLDHIQEEHRADVGETAYQLAMAFQQGHPVCPGAVIPSTLLQGFLQHIDWLEPLFADLPDSTLRLDVSNSRQLQAIARTIRQAIESTALPNPDLAVQLLQWAKQTPCDLLLLHPCLDLTPQDNHLWVDQTLDGMIDSRLTPLTPNALESSLRQLWSSLFSAKSLFYWQRLGIPLQQLRLGVVVHPLHTPERSGDLYLEGQQVELQAVVGVEQGLISGEVCPDWYRLTLDTGETLEQDVGKAIHRCIPRHVPSSPDEAADRWPSLLEGLDLQAIAPALPAVLSPVQLAAVIGVARQMAALSNPLYLKWSLVHPAEAPSPHLTITQVRPQYRPLWRRDRAPSSPLSPPPSPSSSAYPGLGVSPGIASGPAWVVTSPHATLPNLPPGCIIVANMLAPAWLPQLHQVAGIVTEQGGKTSHGAIIARELSIPAVVGTKQATQQFETGVMITVDGDRGEVYIGSAIASPDTDSVTASAADPVAQPEELFSPPDPPEAIAPRPAITQLWVNLSRWQSFEPVQQLPIDGIGLIRSELAILDLLEQRHPADWLNLGDAAVVRSRLLDRLRPIVAAMAPRPVFYRTCDMRSHEYRALLGSPTTTAEPNPILGIHGTLSYQRDRQWFQLELSVLKALQEEGLGNVRLLLPFVRTVEEFQFCRQQVIAAGLERYPDFQVWIMAEVPSVIWLLPDYVAAGVQGITIGSNDLTQLVLGIDRDHPDLSDEFDAHHPAVLRAIAQLVQAAQRLDLPCAICSQFAPSDLAILKTFLQWEVTAISVDPSTVALAHRLMQQARL